MGLLWIDVGDGSNLGAGSLLNYEVRVRVSNLGVMEPS